MSRANGTRTAALAEAAAAVAAGEPVTGAQLAQRHGRSASWGRAVAREARAVAAPPTAPAGEPAAPAAEVAPARRWLDTAVILVVAAVAAAASYGHMVHMAELAGEPLWIARLFPITADGLAVAALRRGSAGRRWLVLALGVSVAANVLTAFPDVAATAGPAVAAWPPVALYGTHRLLHGAGRRDA